MANLVVADTASRCHHQAVQEEVGVGRNSSEHCMVQDMMSAVTVDVAVVVVGRIAGVRR
jgi:hypothetical protein